MVPGIGKIKETIAHQGCVKGILEGVFAIKFYMCSSRYIHSSRTTFAIRQTTYVFPVSEQAPCVAIVNTTLNDDSVKSIC